MLFDDTYLTIDYPTEALFKDRGSRFLAYSFPVNGERDIKMHLEWLYELHPKAVHHCYAWRLGTDRNVYRANDDGEPSGTAGRPILNVLYSKNVTNVLVVVVRYFGGTLLGVPGLINAYKTSTEMVMAEATVVTRHVFDRYRMIFPYERMNDAMRVVKEMELPVTEQKFEMECSMLAEVRRSLTEQFIRRCEKIDDLVVELKNS